MIHLLERSMMKGGQLYFEEKLKLVNLLKLNQHNLIKIYSYKLAGQLLLHYPQVYFSFHQILRFYLNEFLLLNFYKTVFETSDNAEVIDYILAGFSNCSLIAAYFKTTAVFDNIIINLCKYTTLLNQAKVPKRVSIFGNDKKAQLVTLTTFNLILKYGDYLREGWRNVRILFLSFFTIF